MMNSTPGGTRSKVRRLPDRGRYDHESIYRILDAAFLCHIGFSVAGQPFVIPTLFAREEDKLYVHGSSASRMLRELQKGISACVTVTHVDGLVMARSAFHHSINYRSAVVFGTATLITDMEKKLAALERITDQVAPGRWAEVRPPTELELKATSVLEFTIEEASAKVRSGPPKDDDEDYALNIWAGVLPIRTVIDAPVADERLTEGIPLSPSLRKLSGL